MSEEDKNKRCPKCGQTDIGQTGEYTCSECGLPTAWDVNEDIDKAECVDCHGDGFVYVESVEPPFNEVKIQCENCGGKGRMVGE